MTISVMPKGVEHYVLSVTEILTPAGVTISVMPKGVEHTYFAGEKVIPGYRDYLCDAERR